MESKSSKTRQKKDPGWDYNHVKDPTKKNYVTCKFCGFTSSGGIYRAKLHQMGKGFPDVIPCQEVPLEVSEQLWTLYHKKRRGTQNEPDFNIGDNVDDVKVEEAEWNSRGKSASVEEPGFCKTKKTKVLKDLYLKKKPEEVEVVDIREKQGKLRKTSMKYSTDPKARERTIQYIAGSSSGPTTQSSPHNEEFQLEERTTFCGMPGISDMLKAFSEVYRNDRESSKGMTEKDQVFGKVFELAYEDFMATTEGVQKFNEWLEEWYKGKFISKWQERFKKFFEEEGMGIIEKFKAVCLKYKEEDREGYKTIIEGLEEHELLNMKSTAPRGKPHHDPLAMQGGTTAAAGSSGGPTTQSSPDNSKFQLKEFTTFCGMPGISDMLKAFSEAYRNNKESSKGMTEKEQVFGKEFELTYECYRATTEGVQKINEWLEEYCMRIFISKWQERFKKFFEEEGMGIIEKFKAFCSKYKEEDGEGYKMNIEELKEDELLNVKSTATGAPHLDPVAMQGGTSAAAAGSSGGPTTQSSPDNAKQEEDTETEATDIKTEKALVKKAPASKKTTSKRKATSPAASTETAKSNGRASSKPKVAKKLLVSTPLASIREESSDTDPSSDNSPKIIKEESRKGKDTDSSPLPADPSPKKVIESTVEDDDNELEGNVFARMDLLFGHSFKTDKAVAEEEEETVATPPTAEEIQLATSVLGSLLEGDPAAFYQDRRMEEILSSARILARNPELPKDKCKFWHEFPKIFQDLVKCFAEKDKAAEATATANKNVEDGFTLLSNKKEEYNQVKESQLTECQKLEAELAQLEARVSDLKTLISVKQKEMKTRREQLLDELNHLVKKLALEKAAAEALAKMNEGIPRELTNMQLQWKEWRKFL